MPMQHSIAVEIVYQNHAEGRSLTDGELLPIEADLRSVERGNGVVATSVPPKGTPVLSLAPPAKSSTFQPFLLAFPTFVLLKIYPQGSRKGKIV